MLFECLAVFFHLLCILRRFLGFNLKCNMQYSPIFSMIGM
ncbi:unnamed protein product [Callosobruchus maculatus]|uniref:Uncharacterized protein n=1 Tax=Callosobruchus maculatus TaxID=64391 RepID=A0A653DQK1_CALMS|nr:unnamed protein product [Callosobruchus maculatus]